LCDHGRNIATGYERDTKAMQRPGIAQQVALDAFVAAGPQRPLLFRQIEPQRRLDGVGGTALAFALACRRVLAEPDAGMQFACRLARDTKAERTRRSF
jgi:hypothetical protein